MFLLRIFVSDSISSSRSHLYRLTGTSNAIVLFLFRCCCWHSLQETLYRPRMPTNFDRVAPVQNIYLGSLPIRCLLYCSLPKALGCKDVSCLILNPTNLSLLNNVDVHDVAMLENLPVLGRRYKVWMLAPTLSPLLERKYPD